MQPTSNHLPPEHKDSTVRAAWEEPAIFMEQSLVAKAQDPLLDEDPLLVEDPFMGPLSTSL